MDCHAGYICTNGSATGTPVDNIVGYICPTGYYCSQAAIIHQPCEIGTYAPTEGLGKLKYQREILEIILRRS